MMVVDIRLGQDLPAGTPRELFEIGQLESRNEYAVTPDGQRFLAIVPGGTATIGSAIVILNWAAGLQAR